MSGSREHSREPWWRVIAVFGEDDADEGDDFAYTVGLAERGLPELHVWCRPADGEDPGHDWRFSMRDMGLLLNDLAWRLIDRRVRVGDTWETEYDAGLVTVRFRLDDPVDASSVEAFQASPAKVYPVRWSLHRKPLGPLMPMSAGQERDAQAEWARLSDALPIRPYLPAGRQIPVAPLWSADQEWGPRTPLVLAHLARIMNSSEQQLMSLINVAFALETRRLSAHPLVVARSAARDVGRSEALERIEVEVRGVVSAIGIGWMVDEWEAGLAWLNEDDDDPFPEDRLREMLTLVLCSHLATVAVADRLPVAQVLEGLGPINSAFCDDGVSPDDRWNAPAHIVDEVVGLVRLAGARARVAAARAWAALDDEESADARGAVAVLGWRNAAGLPQFSEVLAASLCKRIERQMRTADVPEGVVQTWLSTLAVVLSCRASLTNEEVEPVVGAGGPHMIGLQESVNALLPCSSPTE